MNEKKRYIGAMLLHTVLLVAECIAFRPWPFTEELRYYTQLSNLLEMFVSAAFIAEGICRLKKGKTHPSACVRVLSYATACMLTVTMLTVIFVLSPMQGEGGLKFLMLYEDMLYMHFLCPVIALISFFFFEHAPRLTGIHLLLAMLPTLLYAAVTITLNILKVMRGPYPFLYVYEQPVYMSCVWFIVVVGGAFLITWGLKKLNTAAADKSGSC